ncbi:GntP family permease [Desulfosporosinus sp.]|uniref:GntP family permease n=1 Tax=Desulfosporosinus sp. TaxID=157907 RepID=UPI0025C66983|nr:GntP family permease [Desulfosporosinus sp.]MBC2723053.1 GntP family permease [Desulfosporosinus sp.]MBC2728996.1 GntP family permease [Desulfosporosinus sp.]
MLGVLGVLIAIAVIIFMTYKGWGIIPASLICALIVVLTNDGDIWKSLSVDYVNGFKYFAGTYFLIFVLGALFGQVMGESGSANSISYKLMDRFGESRAILVVALATSILTYGGVNLFIVIFTVYPLALILFKAADLPKRLIVATVGIGAGTFTMTAMPGSPSIQNLIPAQVLGTTATAAPLMGIICSLFLFGAGIWYVQSRANKAKANGEHFVPGPRDNMDKLSLADASELPDWKVAFLPLLVVIGVIFFLKGKMDALYGVSIALAVGISLTYVLNWKRFENPLKALNDGCANSVMALINTAAIVGFGFVVQNVPAFQAFIKFALNMQFNPLVSEAIAVNVIAGITGSASGGLTIFMKTMGPAFLQTGISPEALHRVASIASGGLDSLPHSGAVITLLMVMGLTHKEAYKDLGVVTVVIPLLATALAIIIGIFFY